jgi:hypothetical protein
MYSPFPWLGFFFWVGLFTWFGIMAWSRYLREQERQKTLRAFAERGTPLDKEMMEKLFPAAAWQQESQPWQSSSENTVRGLAIGGIVTLFAGVGLLIGAQLIGQIAREALFGMSAGGIIATCVGLGLVTSSWALRRMQATDKARVAGGSDDQR